MAMNHDKAMYFWHRHLEGADPETRTLRKWNAAYPNDQTTLEEITGFISDVLRFKATAEGGNGRDSDAFDAILTGKPKLTVTKNLARKGRSHSGKADT